MLSIKLHEPAEGVVPGTLQYIEFDFMTGGQEIKITIMKECQVIFPMLFFAIIQDTKANSWPDTKENKTY